MEIKTLDDLREATDVYELGMTSTLRVVSQLLAHKGKELVYEGIPLDSPAALRKARQKHGYSLSKASKITGLHRPNIVVMEQRGTVRLSTLFKILNGYGGKLELKCRGRSRSGKR